jgi:hypothetical protein
MDYYSVTLMTRMEHQMRMRKLKLMMDYAGPIEVSQSNWVARQFQRVLPLLRNGLAVVSKRIVRGQYMSAASTNLQTKGQEVPS